MQRTTAGEWKADFPDSARPARMLLRHVVMIHRSIAIAVSVLVVVGCATSSAEPTGSNEAALGSCPVDEPATDAGGEVTQVDASPPTTSDAGELTLTPVEPPKGYGEDGARVLPRAGWGCSNTCTWTIQSTCSGGFPPQYTPYCALATGCGGWPWCPTAVVRGNPLDPQNPCTCTCQ